MVGFARRLEAPPVSRAQANLLLLLIALIWASAFVAQSQGMQLMGPMLFTGLRFIVGALVVLPLAWRERQALAAQQRAPGWPQARKIAGLGVLLLLGAAMQQIGIAHTSVTNAGFLTALYVPLVPILGILIHRHWPHWSVWPGGLACLIGAFLLSGADRLEIGLGDAWVIGSSLPWAVHVLMVGRVADRMAAPYAVACGQFFVTGLLATLWALVFEPVSAAAIRAAAGPILYTGVLSVGIAFTAQVVAQRYANAADAAIILSAETVFTALFGYWLMGDRLSLSGIAGCALIFASMTLIQLIPLIKRRIS